MVLGGRDDGEVMRCYVLEGRVLSGMGSSLGCVPGCVMLWCAEMRGRGDGDELECATGRVPSQALEDTGAGDTAALWCQGL